MAEWRVGRKVPIHIYDGPGEDPRDEVCVAVGEYERACAHAAQIVTAVNERDALLAIAAKAREVVGGSYIRGAAGWDDDCVPMAWENALHELAHLLEQMDDG